jgi:hypothetical protein
MLLLLLLLPIVHAEKNTVWVVTAFVRYTFTMTAVVETLYVSVLHITVTYTTPFAACTDSCFSFVRVTCNKA